MLFFRKQFFHRIVRLKAGTTYKEKITHKSEFYFTSDLDFEKTVRGGN